MSSHVRLPDVLDETLARIECVTPDAPRQWGTLTVAGMLVHCRKGVEMACGDGRLGRPLIGRLLGGFGKRRFIRGTRRFPKGAPTDPRLLDAGAEDVEAERAALEAAARRYCADGPDLSQPHPFFGKLTREEWDHLMWKHLDHHLRQFGVE